MKVIFDFDDTIFSSKEFKDVLFSGLEKFSISYDTLSSYYFKNRDSFTNPKNFYLSFILDNKMNITHNQLDEVVLGLFVGLKRFLNQELIDIIKKLGAENCFIVSVGEKDFQLSKIKGCEIEELFGEIHIVGENKNETIEELMSKFKGEDFIFLDDKLEHTERAKEIINNEQKLHTIHYPSEANKFKETHKLG